MFYPSMCLFPLLLAWGASPSSCSLSFAFCSAPISITTFYVTLIVVGVMSSRKSSKTQPRCISLPLSLSLSLYYLPSLFSFSLVSGAVVSKGSSLVILGTDTSRISALPRTSAKLISLRGSLTPCLVSVFREVYFYFSLPELDGF